MYLIKLITLIFFLLFVTDALFIQNQSKQKIRTLQNLLRIRECDRSIQITNSIVTPAARKGQNYATDVRRVVVQYSGKHGSETRVLSLIIKIAIFDEPDDGLFSTEMYIMANVLKKMNASLINDKLLTPKLLDFSKTPRPFIVMEDLKPLGYRNKDRQEGLDFEHSQLAIDTLAKFHAASVSVLEKEPREINRWWRGIVHTLDETYIRKKLQTLADLMKGWGEVASLYSDKVLQMSKTLHNATLKASLPKKDGFNVLIHGDYTTRNMLFKYNSSNQPTSLMLVDFQFCQFTSPVIDLWYLLGTSALNDIQLLDATKMVKRYHNVLEATMKSMGTTTEVITEEQLLEDFLHSAIFYFYCTTITLPWNLIEESEIRPTVEMFPYIQKHPEVFYNDKFREIFVKRLPFFMMIGLFD